VRSLVHDLGQALGCGAVTDKIRRLAIGPFRVEDASSPESLAPGMALLPPDLAVAHLPPAVVPEDWVARFLNGQAFNAESLAPGGGGGAEYRALDGSGRLLAIATLSPQGMLCPRKVLAKA
jgi:tRNA pseudouridine55 synthase